MAIRHRQLQRLRNDVDVVGAVVSERGQVEPIQDLQRFDERGTLAPGSAGVHGEIAEAPGHGRLDAHAEAREVLVREEAALFLHERGDLVGDVASVERVASGADRRLAPGAGGGPFRIDQPIERLGEPRLFEAIALAQARPVGLEQRPEPRRGVDHRAHVRQEVRQGPLDHEPVEADLARGGDHLLERHRAEALQRREPCIGCRGRHAAEDGRR